MSEEKPKATSVSDILGKLKPKETKILFQQIEDKKETEEWENDKEHD
jgi:hypothetical protein